MQARRYAVSEIADIISRADGLRLSDHESTLHRIRHFAKKGLLNGAEVVDARGTLSFPALEVYRARIFLALGDLAIDARALRETTEAAERAFDLRMAPPPSMVSEHGIQSHGGLRDSIRGVSSGEVWGLILKAYNPGHVSEKKLTARFLWDGEKRGPGKSMNRVFGTGPVYACALVNLTNAYTGLLEQIGVPD